MVGLNRRTGLRSVADGGICWFELVWHRRDGEAFTVSDVYFFVNTLWYDKCRFVTVRF